MPDMQLNNEIRELNLSYLMLARELLVKSPDSALMQLGIDEQTAELIGQLSSAQLIQIASTNILLSKMRFTDENVWSLLQRQVDKSETLSKVHVALLFANEAEENANDSEGMR